MYPEKEDYVDGMLKDISTMPITGLSELILFPLS
jgi:hypothetical protein